MQTLPPTTEMQRAYLASDASYDGVFFLAVRTTGIFCRPSCRARKPRPENVVYFATARKALFAGYRPCKRCRPLAINGDLIGRARYPDHHAGPLGFANQRSGHPFDIQFRGRQMRAVLGGQNQHALAPPYLVFLFGRRN